MLSRRSTTPSSRRFKKLYTLTSEICVIDSENNCLSIVQQKAERWEILLDIWRKNSRRVGKNVFLNVLSHIFTGEYLTHKKEKTISLFREIESALINDDEIFHAWLSTALFQKTLIDTIYKVYSLKHVETFQVSQGVARLFGKESRNDLVSTLIPNMHKFLEFTIGDVKEKSNRIKEKIKCILPEADGWREEQWPNTMLLSTSIAQKYGFNPDKTFERLEDIFDLIYLSENRDHHFRIDNIVDADLNYDFVKAIFKDEADSIILFLLNDIIPSIEGEWVDASSVSGSWLHNILQEWAYNETHLHHDEARRIMFDLTMQYHV